jgi:hypothetical protein
MDLTPKPTWKYQVSSQPGEENPNGVFAKVDVPVVEANLSGGNIVGTVKDPGTKGVKGPIAVLASCFDASGKLLSQASGFTEGNEISPGGTTTFSLMQSFSGSSPCPIYLVGASGYNT